MGIQVYRNNYQAAFSSANEQLQSIYNEYHELQIRKEKLEGVVTALQTFLETRGQAHQDIFIASPSLAAPEPAHQSFQEPVARFEKPVETISRFEQPMEPVAPIAPPAFAAVADDSIDPLQRRINRALGLAVA